MSDVSRETPPSPPEARGVFSETRLAVAERYVELLATEGTARGLIGPREAGRLWDRHVLNSAALMEVVPSNAAVCDVGSGAGLPGMVLAIARQDVAVTLVEPMLRRTTFLTEVVRDLSLTNVAVVRARAEELHGTHTFDIVASRAVAPMTRLLEWCMPLVAPDGALVAMKGASVETELVEAAPTLRSLGCGEVERIEVGTGLSTTTLVRVSWAVPRRVGSSRSRSGSRDTRRGRKSRGSSGGARRGRTTAE